MKEMSIFSSTLAFNLESMSTKATLAAPRPKVPAKTHSTTYIVGHVPSPRSNIHYNSREKAEASPNCPTGALVDIMKGLIKGQGLMIKRSSAGNDS